MDNETAYNDIMQDSEKALAPPYISFLTFYNCVTWLEDEGIPLRFDRSFWQKKYSGSVGPQLMNTLRFLGLLKNDTPQPDLHKLVDAKGEERNSILAEIIRTSYTSINFDDISRATPAMLTEWLGSYGIERDTLRKAESFFINACKSVEIPLSKSLSKKARNKPAKSVAGATRERRRKKGPPTPQEHHRKPPIMDSTSEAGQVSRVTLASGGEVMLAINVDLFRLSREDRDFVLKLVDIVKGYDKKEENAKEDIPF